MLSAHLSLGCVFFVALTEGTIPFKRTCEGDILTPVDTVSESSDDSQQGIPADAAIISQGGSPPQGGTSPPSNTSSNSTSAQTVPIAASPTTMPKTPTRMEAINIGNTMVGSGTSGAPTTLLLTAGGDGHPVIVCAEPTRQPVVKPLPPPQIPATPVYFTLAATGQTVSNGTPALVKQRSISAVPMSLTTAHASSTPITSSGPKKKSSLSTKPTQIASSQQTNKNRIIKFHEYKVYPTFVASHLLKYIHFSLVIQEMQLI